MSTKKPRAVSITEGQANILNTLTAEAQAIQGRTEVVVATIAAGANIEKWGTVELKDGKLIFGEPQED